MKLKTKKNLIGILLSTFLVVGVANIASGEKNIIKTNPDTSELHTVSLHSLFLGLSEFDTGFSRLRVSTGRSSLDVLNGLIVGKSHTVSSLIKLVVIGGGENNQIDVNNAGIAGGYGNIVNGENGAIGGGYGNIGSGTIGGGGGNQASAFSVVLGGFGNSADNGGVVLGGRNNKALGENALVFGSGASGETNSFAWNTDAKENSARINASGGVLIGTYMPVSGVSLVVGGAIRLGSGDFDGTTGGVWVDGSGCIKASDGNTFYVLGGGSESVCGVLTGCQFGETILHNGDKVAYYPVTYASDCGSIKQTAICSGGIFYDSGNNQVNDLYPYCYDLSKDPILTVATGLVRCNNLPYGAEWVNGYWDKSLGGNQPDPSYYTGNSVECSFKCKESTVYDTSNKRCGYECGGGNSPDLSTTISGGNISTEPKDWKYITGATASLLACQWTCKNANFQKKSGDNSYSCECKSGYTLRNGDCVKNTCTGSVPRGVGVITGTGIPEYNNMSWTYTDNSNPGVCQWTCKNGYERNGTTMGCVCKFTVTYDPNGGKWLDGTTTNKISSNVSCDNITLEGKPSKESCSFQGRRSSSDGGLYGEKVSYSLTEDTTMTAYWDCPTTASFKVTFKANENKIIDPSNGQATTNDVVLTCTTSGASCSIKSPSIIAHDNTPTVIGWSASSTNHTSQWDQGVSQDISSDMTYYAQTKKNAVSRYISFWVNGNTSFTYNGTTYTGNEKTDLCTIVETYNGDIQGTGCSKTITFPTITASPKTPNVIGWSTSSTAHTGNYVEGQLATLMASSDLSYYAQTKNGDKVMKVNLYTGSGVSSIGASSKSCTISMTYNGVVQGTSCSVKLPTCTVKDCYENCKFGTYSPETDYTITSDDVELTATAKIKKYGVTFKTNGGQFSDGTTGDKSYDVACGGPIGLYSVTWSSHTFGGWYTAQNGGFNVGNSGNYRPTSDVILRAHWD